MRVCPVPQWKLSNTRAINVDRPCVVCILNVTPDSFADGGAYWTAGGTVGLAVDRVKRAVDEGADMIDIGGESTRPGARRVGVDEQIRRVVPVIEAIRREGIKAGGIDVPISVDTTRSVVAAAALDAGADAVNDVSAMTEDEGMVGLVGDRGCGVVLMHRLVEPGMDSYSDRYEKEPVYRDVVGEVRRALGERIDVAVGGGVEKERIVVDPGLGFGKSVEDNLALIRGTGEIVGLGCPVMSGLSRKSFVGRIGLGRDSEPIERVEASVELSVEHLKAGAMIFRVHDVGEHRVGLDRAWGELVGR